MFRVRSPYPLFAVALLFIVAVLLNPRASAKAAEPNGGQRVLCGAGLFFNGTQSVIERFLREHPERRISLIDGSCIVHEPVR